MQVRKTNRHKLRGNKSMSIQYNRRDLMRGMVGGAVSLALAPIAFAQLGPPPGKIALRFNENPYGPSASARKAAAD